MVQKNTPNFSILILGALIILAVYLSSCNEPKIAHVDYFTHMQVLLPDMACPDTLIVLDAEGLNDAFAPIEQGITGQDYGDADYDNLFHKYCLTFNEYVKHLRSIGYREDIATNLALVDFGRIKPDALYTSIMED